jgi:hypothetical protein
MKLLVTEFSSTFLLLGNFIFWLCKYPVTRNPYNLLRKHFEVAEEIFLFVT